MSSMALNKLVFDPSNADDSANVGAYLRASDGTLLTHTDVGGKKALDVRLAEGVNVEVDLSHVDDSVKVGDGTDFLAVNSDGSINTKQAGASSAAYGATSVTTTATDIVGSDLANRIQIMIQNIGNKDCYIGANASVTPSTGILLARGAAMVLDVGAGINIHGITASGTADVRYFELAG